MRGHVLTTDGATGLEDRERRQDRDVALVTATHPHGEANDTSRRCARCVTAYTRITSYLSADNWQRASTYRVQQTVLQTGIS